MSAPGFKVMLVDDSNTVRRSAQIFMAALVNAGMGLVLCENGFDALEQLPTELPDLIFMDVMMPELGGFETCSIIKADRRFKHIPVVMLSSKESPFDRARGRLAGSSMYMTKPFEKNKLIEVVESYRAARSDR